jgi:ABC-2 type transport system permease protein
MGDLARQEGRTKEFANPLKLLSGDFDLSYVLVFIFPLLIIILFYSLYSAEQERGTLSLLKAQSSNIYEVFFGKALVRVLILFSLTLVLLILGFVLQGISILENLGLFVQWLTILGLYYLAWVLFIGVLVSLKYNSTKTAMLALSTWLVITVISPALLDLILFSKEPPPNRSNSIHVIRTASDQFWKKPKSFVWDQFYQNNPKLNHGDTTNFVKWYYASMTLNDQKAEVLNSGYEKQVENRNEQLENYSWLAPAAKVNQLLSATVRTDRASFMHFRQATKAMHKELQDFYFEHIFSDETFTDGDLKMLESKL